MPLQNEWCAWFKLHYPKEFYEVYFELCNQKNLIKAIKKGEGALSIYKLGYYDGVADNLYIDDETQHPLFVDILVAEEMFARGITIEFACAK